MLNKDPRRANKPNRTTGSSKSRKRTPQIAAQRSDQTGITEIAAYLDEEQLRWWPIGRLRQIWPFEDDMYRVRDDESARQRKLAYARRTQIRPSTLQGPQRTDELMGKLGSDERLAQFKTLVSAYERNPDLENYVRLRRDFPEVEIDVGQFGGIDQFYDLEPELRRHGIDEGVALGALDADQFDIDELSLGLMERLISRAKAQNRRPGYIEERRRAISDTLVNHLIIVMLEAMQANKENQVVVTSSLLALIRHQLCGPMPDIRKAYISHKKREQAAFIVAQQSVLNKNMSVRTLAKLVGVKKSRAAMWLADPEFNCRVASWLSGPRFKEFIERYRLAADISSIR
jgi:hypothetical protein